MTRSCRRAALAGGVLLWIGCGTSVRAGEQLFRLVAEETVTLPARLVESPGSPFVPAAKRPGLAKMLLEAGVSNEEWHEEGHPNPDAGPEMDPRMVRLLVKASEDPDVVVGRGGQTALMQAVELGLDEAVELLLDKGADVQRRDSQGRTAMDYAVRGNRHGIVAMLVAAGAIPPPPSQESNSKPAVRHLLVIPEALTRILR